MGYTIVQDIWHGVHNSQGHLAWGTQQPRTFGMGYTIVKDIWHGVHNSQGHLAWGTQ